MFAVFWIPIFHFFHCALAFHSMYSYVTLKDTRVFTIHLFWIIHGIILKTYGNSYNYFGGLVRNIHLICPKIIHTFKSIRCKVKQNKSRRDNVNFYKINPSIYWIIILIYLINELRGSNKWTTICNCSLISNY